MDSPLFGYLRWMSDRSVANEAYSRIESFLTKGPWSKTATASMEIIRHDKSSDVAILNRLRSVLNPPPSVVPKLPGLASLTLPPVAAFGLHAAPPPQRRSKSESGRENSRLKDIHRELVDLSTRAQESIDCATSSGAPRNVREPQKFRYLDIGCAEGRITAALTKALHLSRDQAHACDIVPQPESSVFTFSLSDFDTLHYDGECFDIVTMFMVAHHCADAPRIFREARRVLKKGGRLLIREHDCGSEAHKLFYDVVHAIYGCVTGSEITPEDFVAQLVAKGFSFYRTKNEWLKIIENAGFVRDAHIPVHGSYIGQKYTTDQFDSFYAYFTRVN